MLCRGVLERGRLGNKLCAAGTALVKVFAAGVWENAGERQEFSAAKRFLAAGCLLCLIFAMCANCVAREGEAPRKLRHFMQPPHVAIGQRHALWQQHGRGALRPGGRCEDLV